MTLRAALALAIPLFAQEAQLDANRALFNVMVAINAAGYDAEIDSPNNHPLRKRIRAEIESRNFSTVPELKRFFAAHRKGDPALDASQYVSFALSVDGSDQYRWRFREDEIPPDAAALEGLGALMTRFHRQARLDQLWQLAEPEYEKALQPFFEPVTLALQEVSGYLRVPTAGGGNRKFRVYVELMGAPNQVHVRSYAADSFVVLTPSPELHVPEIRAAYIAFHVDPLATRNAEKVEAKRPLIDLAQSAPLLPEQYKTDFLLLTTKSLSRAIEARLASVTKREAMVRQALGEGFILTPYFAEALAAYEKQEQSMRLYYPEMIAAIDLKKEDRRLQGVEFLTSPAVKTVRAVVVEKPLELTGVRKTLEDAELLYTARKLPEARAAFLKSLEETGEKPLQSKAYYGLARIAALQKDPELAVKLFEKVLELEPEPPVRAWSHVYLGRLFGLAGDTADARRHLDDALRVAEATPAAREAARKALDELNRSQP